MKQFLRKYFLGLIITLVLAIVALATYQQYGVSWDEPTQRQLAIVTYRYMTGADKVLLSYDDKALGTAFEIPLIYIEKWANMTDTRDIYLMRHLVTHFFFLFSLFCGYVLALKLFKKQWIAILGILMLALEPRIYAHSFFNSKDIPFLSAMLISFLCIQVAFEKNRWHWYLLAGIAVGYAMAIRIIGIILVPAVVTFLIIDTIRGFMIKDSPYRSIFHLQSFLIGASAMLYISWPLLWVHPIDELSNVFTRMSSFPFGGFVLFNGKMVPGDHLPVEYLPMWMAISIPELWTLLFGIGSIWVCISFVRKPLAMVLNKTDRNHLLYFYAFLFPAVAVIVNHTVIIDDWRHVYFIYPPLVFLGLYALSKMTGRMLRTAAILIAGQTALVLVIMVQLFPFSQVYFNFLKPHKEEYFRKNFDFEYWCAAYCQGMEYITDHDKSDTVKIFWRLSPVLNAQQFIPKHSRERVRLVHDLVDATYLITSFRGHPEDFEYPVYYEIKRENSTIMRVYKLK